MYVRTYLFTVHDCSLAFLKGVWTCEARGQSVQEVRMDQVSVYINPCDRSYGYLAILTSYAAIFVHLCIVYNSAHRITTDFINAGLSHVCRPIRRTRTRPSPHCIIIGTCTMSSVRTSTRYISGTIILIL